MIDIPTLRLWVGLAVALLLTAVVGQLFRHVPPPGIVDFELAGGADKASAILADWRHTRSLADAQANLWIDMAWIPGYVAALALGCLLVARLRPGGWATFGALVAAGQLLAGALDYAENVALLRVLRDFKRQHVRLGETSPRIAAWCAAMKFRLVTLGLVYITLGAMIGLLAG